MKPYRPSNCDSGESFVIHFCDRCIHDRAARAGDYENGCPIYARALGFNIRDPLYPKEWVQDDDGSNPRCTAFLDEGDSDDRSPQPDPDPLQLVLIADPTEDIALPAPDELNFPMADPALEVPVVL